MMYYTIVKIGERYECHCSSDMTKVISLTALESAIGASNSGAAEWMHAAVCRFETIYQAKFLGISEATMAERYRRTEGRPVAELK